VSALTPADIVPGVVVTNGRGRYRLVTEVVAYDTYSVAYYVGAYANTKGKMMPSPRWTDDMRCGVPSIARWSTRLATPGERADVVRALNPKGTE
jgi:hypothetical protein